MKTKVTNKLRKIEEGMIILKHKALGMLSDFVNVFHSVFTALCIVFYIIFHTE